MNNRTIDKLNSDNILVKLLPKEDLEKQDGIYIPDSINQSKHLSQLAGEVQALGIANIEPDGERPFSVKVGEIVVIEKTAGINYTKDNEKYLIIKESDILLILNKKDI